MTRSLETVRRLQAWHAGKPLPRGEVLNVHVADDDDLYILAFLRMGGESRPWAIAHGTVSDGITVVATPEGRNRDDVADMVLQWAPSFLGFFRHPDHCDEGPAIATSEPLRQIWMPGQTHVEMLQYLAAAYARSKWDRDGIETLRAVGNLANCLFIESQRPGQQTILTATDALRRSFIFPTAPVRQGHLGHLLAWLEGDTTRDGRFSAALSAEKHSVATVVNPEVERTMLQPHLEKWHAARKDARHSDIIGERSALCRVLEEELTRRWNLTKSSIEVLRRDPRLPNPGLVSLADASKQEMWRNWGDKAVNEHSGQPAFWPNVFTDHSPRSAAGAFHFRLSQEERAQMALLHGDKELQREELARGHGFICVVDTVDTTDAKRTLWRVRVTYPEIAPCKVGDKFVLAGAPSFKLEVVDIADDDVSLVLKPSWKNDKKEYGSKGLAAAKPQWVNTAMVLLQDAPDFLSTKKATKSRTVLSDAVDITDFISVGSRRHGALDDDGVFAPSGDES